MGVLLTLYTRVCQKKKVTFRVISAERLQGGESGMETNSSEIKFPTSEKNLSNNGVCGQGHNDETRISVAL